MDAGGGWKAVDVWESERVLFVEFDGPTPHTVLASVLDVGGVVVNELAVLRPGAAAAWGDLREDGEVPMPVAGRPAEEVLTELAAALRQTDMLWPGQGDEDLVALGALAWARCRGPPGRLTRVGGASGRAAGGAHRGQGGPRRRAARRAARGAAPLAAFRSARRGVAPEWIDPVVVELDVSLPEFEGAFDDKSSWGPAMAVVAELTKREVDLSDRADPRRRDPSAQTPTSWRRLTQG